jgi:O-antigen/teichoic acid export membrane protein
MTDIVPDEHLEPTEEINLETVKARSVRGIVTLTARYFILYGMSSVASVFLGVFLTTAQFGTYGIVSAFVNFLVYFSDIGLAASLIQKKDKVTEEDLKTTFTVQQILVIFLLSILLVFSKSISKFYSLNNDGLILLYALGVSFLLSSLKTIPSVLLERKLEFEKITLSHILENMVYFSLLVFLAWKGFGIKSYTISVLARSVVGVVSLYLLKPWTPKFGISRKSLKKLLHFGIPYQINTLIALVKDDGLAIALGKIIGIDDFGILIWAQKWANMPLRFFMDQVTKVTFPAFARMQDEKEHLKRTATRSIFFICFLVFPSIIGLLVLSPIIIKIIPKYEKWTPALFPLILLSINTMFAAVTTQLTNLLNAIGKIKTTTKLMVMWTILTWSFVPFLGYKFGVNGAALGYSLVGASSLIAIHIVKKTVNFSLYHSAAKPALASILMGMVMFIVRSALPLNALSVWVLILVGMGTYSAGIIFLVGVSLIADVKKTIKTFFNHPI